ncbi:MAG: hypothetical protein E2O37_03310 [Proteobacteria bacterium]|nr:MAG: hypothetical protein E2O37_03310 [Pseudomonadota bacterium]TDJ69612.1 MAG: hypothetical protein E2O38_13190 [Pseudomonadota bacterium]
MNHKISSAGFMEAMTTGYSVTSQELTKGFKPGDSVKFRSMPLSSRS